MKDLMKLTEHYSLLEKVYVKAPVNAIYAPKMKVSEGFAEIEIELSPKYHHGMHAVHGSVVFKMADDAGFFAANSVLSEFFVLTANFNIHFLRPVVSGKLIGVGKVIHKGSRQILVDVECINEEGKVVAQGRGVYMPSKFPLIEALD